MPLAPYFNKLHVLPNIQILLYLKYRCKSVTTIIEKHVLKLVLCIV